MKRSSLFVFLPVLVFLVPWGAPVAAPLEFYAVVQEKVEVDAASTDLIVQLTPDFTLAVRVTSLTGIKDRDGMPIGLDEIQPGDLIAVEAIHTESGLLALEVQKQDQGSEFELKGILESVDPGADPPTIQLLGLTVVIGPETRIWDHTRQILTLDALYQRLIASLGPIGVKVAGSVAEGAFVAATVHVLGPEQRFARINLEGTIVEFKTDAGGANQFLLDIGGGVQVLVQIIPETQITGELVVGSLVKVKGLINPTLGVTALTIQVVELWDVAPPRLEMKLDDSREVTILLRRVADVDLEFEVSTAPESLVEVEPHVVTIPAGALNGKFGVKSGASVGESWIEVKAPPELGGGIRRVPVRVAARPEPKLHPSTLEWAPRAVHAVPPAGRVVVRLMVLPGPARTDLTAALTLVEASSDLLLEFPEEVLIPVGAVGVPVTLDFGSRTGSGKLKATLVDPDGLEIESAELEIELKPATASRLQLKWQPDSLRIIRGGTGTARLVLNAPAPVELLVTINPDVKSGIPIRIGFPGQVRIAVGSTEAVVEFKAGEQDGRARFHAALPRESGGSAATLEIHVGKP